LDEIAKQVSAAQERVAVIVDGCALCYGVTSGVKDFLEKTKFPVLLPPWVNLVLTSHTNDTEAYVAPQSAPESPQPAHAQMYTGRPSLPAVKQTIEQAALIVSISAIYSDINTGSFSHDLPKAKLIEVGFSTSLIFSFTHLRSTAPF